LYLSAIKVQPLNPFVMNDYSKIAESVNFADYAHRLTEAQMFGLIGFVIGSHGDTGTADDWDLIGIFRILNITAYDGAAKFIRDCEDAVRAGA
jgi:hypothetical protein